jgi:formylmethanofuran dehydrogenase subunit E
VSVGPRFTAQFDSNCASCGELILVGDEPGYVDDEVVCGDCYDTARDEENE